MNIAGIQKTTLVDFPGRVAATIFTRGCTFRCGFCHNPELVLPREFIPLLDEKEIIEFFKKRAGKLQGVCITGGEPTMNQDLSEFINQLKELDYAIKLDTNGSNPIMLKELIDSSNLDYIAMDIKASPDNYQNAASTKIEIKKISQSIKLIMQSGIDYEFRTTVCHPIHSVEEFKELGKFIQGAKRYFIQNFVQSKHNNKTTKYSEFSDEEIEMIKKTMLGYVSQVKAR